MISLNREYKTVGGDRVEIYAIDGAGDYPVQGAYFRESTGEWIPETWTPDGKTIKGIEYDSRGERIPFRETDLIEVEEENWAYFLLYESGKCEYQYGFTSKESAEKAMEDIKLAIENYNETAVSSSYRRLIRADLIKIKNTRSESE